MGERDLPADGPGPRRRGARPCSCAPATPTTALAALAEARGAARVPRGRPDPGRGVPARRPGRRGRRLRRARCCSGAGARGRRPGHHHHRRRAAPATSTDVTLHRRTTCGITRLTMKEEPLMFTGIVEELGTVVEARAPGRRRPADRARAARHRRRRALGDSIAVNGCLPDRRRARATASVHRRRDGRDARHDPASARWARATGSTSSAPSRRRPGSAATSSRATSTAPGPIVRRGRPASTGRSSSLAARRRSPATSSTRARSPSTASA